MDKEKTTRFNTNESGNIEAEVMCYIKAASEMPREEISDLWYLRSEMASIRKESKRFAWEIQRRHTLDPSNPKSYTNAYRKVYDFCSEGNVPKDHEDMLQLAHWIGACPSRRGLEKRSITGLCQERQARTHEYIKFVVQLTSFDAKDVNVPENDLPDFIQQQATEKSLVSRRFARCLGVADQLAAWKEQQEDEIVSCALFGRSQQLLNVGNMKDGSIGGSGSPAISCRQRLNYEFLVHNSLRGQTPSRKKKNTVGARNA